MALPALLVKAKGALTKAGKAKKVAGAAVAANDASDGMLGETAKKALPIIGCSSLGCLIVPLMIFIIIFSNIFGAIQIAAGDTGNRGSSNASVNSYLEWAINIANDDSHGYNTCTRDGRPDYDCSSFVWFSLIDGGGFTEEQLGGNRNDFRTWKKMPEILKSAGFKEYTYTGPENLLPGDILLIIFNQEKHKGHTEIYYGDGKIVGASSNGGEKCGSKGDQTGKEIDLTPVTKYKWDKYYRLEG